MVFKQPVEVGSLLQLDSCVLFTTANESPYTLSAQPAPATQSVMHVEVIAYVTKPEVRSSVVSNTFYFSFAVDGPVPRIVPNNLSDAHRMLSRMQAEAAQAAV